MLAATTIADEILDLKGQRKAILLAHHYQEPEIQELADVVGDSLELARRARDFAGDNFPVRALFAASTHPVTRCKYSGETGRTSTAPHEAAGQRAA